MFSILMDVVYLALLLSAGCLIATIKPGKICLFDTMPVVCMSITAILYIAGIIGLPLTFGVLLWIAPVVFLGIYSLIIRRRGKTFCEMFCKEGIFLLLLFSALMIVNYGKLAQWNDEFSHWMDTVKVMTVEDRFSTDASFRAIFPSYPPAMSLFQYFYQKITSIFAGGRSFVEWRAYQGYQVYLLALLLPVAFPVGGSDWKKKIVGLGILILLPTAFFSNVYMLVIIDPFVAVLAGAGFSLIAFGERRDVLYHATVALITFVLTLSKDVGGLFAAAVAVAYGWDILRSRKKWIYKGISVLPAITFLIARYSWKYELMRKNVPLRGFMDSLDLKKYAGMFFAHNGSGYQQETIDRYQHAFFEWGAPIGDMGIRISWFVWMQILLLGSGGLLWVIHKSDKKLAVQFGRVFVVGVLTLLTFVFGLGAVYVTQFSEYEALNLASYARYIGMPYGALWILLICGTWNWVLRTHPNGIRWRWGIVGLAVIVLTSSSLHVGLWMTREYVRRSIRARGEYEVLANMLSEYAQPGKQVYFISEGDAVEDWVCMKYLSRPVQLRSDLGDSLGSPRYEGDIWTHDVPVGAWQQFLMENCDYVALLHVDSGFVSDYGSLFADPQRIGDDQLYRVDRENGTLTAVNPD